MRPGAIQLQLREEEWGRDDDDERGGSPFHWRLFSCFCSFSFSCSLFLAESRLVQPDGGQQTAAGHNSFSGTLGRHPPPPRLAADG